MGGDFCEMSEAVCKSCPLWFAMGAQGQCRKGPPHVALDDKDKWPRTWQHEWCGEHPERKAVPTPKRGGKAKL